jgi:GGDEF domain-containing protein
MLDAVRRPMTIGDRELTCSASAGVAVSQAGDDAGTVVDKAEAALALAKAAGGDGQVLYRSDEAHPVRTRREFRTAALQIDSHISC